MIFLYGTLEATRAAFGMFETALRYSEMVLASGTVIKKRSGTIGAAFRDPLNADHRELSRMVTEKQSAFRRAGEVLMNEWLEWQRFWSAELALAGSQERDVMSGGGGRIMGSIDAVTRMLAAPGHALTPIHGAATANAKRLGPSKKISSRR